MALSPTDHIPYSPYSPASSQNSPSTLTPLSSASSSPPNLQLPLSSTYAPTHQLQQPQHQHMYHQQHAYLYEQDEKEHYSGSSVTSEPNDLEGKVAGMIVGARKSWKNVKGRTERVWPAELEASLVRGLLAYKPTDSRYARALGRFPKRNRFISDFIFNETGQRRSPKQVGSRLQQLKDVQCGKQLLNQVANRSLGLPPDVTIGVGSASNGSSYVSLPSPHGIPNHGYGANFFLDTVSPTASPTSAYSAADARFSLDSHSPLSSTGSLSPKNAMVLNVYVKIARNAGFHTQIDGVSSSYVARACPLARFGGSLSSPETVVALPAQGMPQQAKQQQPRIVKQEQQDAPSLHSFEPVVAFSSRMPVGAQSMATLYLDNQDGTPSIPRSQFHSASLVANTSPSTSTSGSAYDTAYGVKRSMGVALGMAGGMAMSPAMHWRPTSAGSCSSSSSCGNETFEDDRSNFVYSASIATADTWAMLCNDPDPTRYSIIQELVCTFDLPGGHYHKNDVLLKVIYHFTTSSVPPSPQFVQSRRLASLGRFANGSVSPVALSNPDSPAAPQSSEMSYGTNSQMANGLDFVPLMPSSSGLMPATATQLAMSNSNTMQDPTSAFNRAMSCSGAHPQIAAYASPVDYGVTIGQSAHPYSHSLEGTHTSAHAHAQALPMQTDMHAQAFCNMPASQGETAGGMFVGVDSGKNMHAEMAPSFSPFL